MPYDWAVQQLRLSLFSNGPVVLTENDWKTLTGQDEAENRVAIPGGKQFFGSSMGGQLSIGYSASRADIMLNYFDAQPDLTKEVVEPVIGKWSDLSASFASSMSSFLGDFQFPIIRIAFGGVLLLRTETREESYGKLDELLSSVAVDPKSKELTYRVNWPRMSQVADGVELNRITSWGSVHFGRAILQLTDMQLAGPNLNVAQGDPMAQFVRLEIDHNTAPSRLQPFDKGQLIPIFEELVELARENANVGECK